MTLLPFQIVAFALLIAAAAASTEYPAYPKAAYPAPAYPAPAYPAKTYDYVTSTHPLTCPRNRSG